MTQNKDTQAVNTKGFDYDAMVQHALHGVIRDALQTASKDGLVNNHHFYLTFQTNRSDVEMPDSLRQKHPEEITIVLQHQFWDLKTDAHKFEVTLSFNDQLEKLVVPFNAMISFLDPSVKFGLQFVPTPPVAGDKKHRSKGLKEKGAIESIADTKVVVLDAFRRNRTAR